jgi:hypothetical protein
VNQDLNSHKWEEFRGEVQRYMINKHDILKIANGKQGTYRMMLSNKKYVEGRIEYKFKNNTYWVPEPFIRFYKGVWGK